MRILINAISIKDGGGWVVLNQLLSRLCHIDKNIKLYVAIRENLVINMPSHKNIILLPYAWANKTPFHVLFWYEITLPKLIKKLNINILFSQTNFVPRRSVSCPSLLLVHHAGYFSENYKNLHRQHYKEVVPRLIFNQKIKWVKRSIKKSTAITVQTSALATSILEKMPIKKEKVNVVSHGAGIFNETNQPHLTFPENTILRIGYITKFGIQKNFLVIVRALALLKQRNIQFKMILTLSDHDYDVICADIKKYNLLDAIENHGDLSSVPDLKNLYHSLHFFVFASTCESFGFCLVEAMACGLPVLVADTTSNREVAGEGAIYFECYNANGLFDAMVSLIENKSNYAVASQYSLQKVRDYCWDKTAQSIYSIIENLNDTNTYDSIKLQ